MWIHVQGAGGNPAWSTFVEHDRPRIGMSIRSISGLLNRVSSMVHMSIMICDVMWCDLFIQMAYYNIDDYQWPYSIGLAFLVTWFYGKVVSPLAYWPK